IAIGLIAVEPVAFQNQRRALGRPRKRPGSVGFPAEFPAKRSSAKKESPPELIVLADFAKSGRLDSNQRPPEPHLQGPGSKNTEKPADFIAYVIPHFTQITLKSKVSARFAASCCNSMSHSCMPVLAVSNCKTCLLGVQ